MEIKGQATAGLEKNSASQIEYVLEVTEEMMAAMQRALQLQAGVPCS